MNREVEIGERSRNFRQEYRDSTPTWYRGEYHLAFTLCFTGGVFAYCLMQLRNPTWVEWLLIAPIALFGNWAEWAGHRYLLHRPTRLLKMAYKRHVAVHHQFFTHRTLSYSGQRDWRALLFPPFAPVLFVLSALPVAVVLGILWSGNAGYIVMITMSGYYLVYEGLHTLSHIENSPFLDRVPLVNTVRRMHVTHHNPDFMHTRNFNLTFPICDALFGTSDLTKGVLGTLFNGNADDALRAEDRLRLEQQRRGRQPLDAPASGASRSHA